MARFVLPRDPDKQLLYKIQAARKDGRLPVIRPAANPAGSQSTPGDSSASIPTGGVVTSIAKTGSAKLTDDVTLSEGDNITLTQVGNDIEIMSASSKSIAFSIPHMMHDVDGFTAIGGASTVYSAYGFSSETPAASAGEAMVVARQTAHNYSTGAVQEYFRVSCSLRRLTNVLLLSSNYLIYGQFPKVTDTAEAIITMKELTAPSAEATYSFHITDGTTVSSAPGSQFTGIGTSWGQFSTGAVDVSSYADALYWIFHMQGPTTDAGSDLNTSTELDFHSVQVLFT